MLSNKDKITGYIAKWIVAHIAAKINSSAVLSLCIETSREYYEKNHQFWNGKT